MADPVSSTFIVVMTKFPEPGKVKTRLAVKLGEQGACDLHAAMVDHLLEKTLSNLDEVNIQFHVAGGSSSQVDAWLAGWSWKPQRGECLGEKMQNAIQSSLDQGAKKVIIMGTDAPAITANHVRSMIDSLESHDVVFTPALDGGYVMAGMKAIHQEMFEGITWSSESVLSQSVEQLQQSQKTVFLQEPLSDVDTPEDLEEAVLQLGCKPW